MADRRTVEQRVRAALETAALKVVLSRDQADAEREQAGRSELGDRVAAGVA